MIGHRLAAPWRELPLGADRYGRVLPWVFALLAYVAALDGIGLTVLDDTRRASEELLATTLTLEVPPGASTARLETVVALLRQTPGIVSVHLLEPAETSHLLEPWLGPSAPLDQLPVPRLIDLRIDTDRGLDVAALNQKLASVVPDARLDDHRGWPKRMRGATRRIEGILAVWTGVALLLIAAAATFAVGAALKTPRSAAALLQMLGAADSEIARAIAIRSLQLALLGAVVGAVAALLTIAALSGAGSIVQLPAPIALNGLGDWRVWAILGTTVVGVGLIAMASAWVAARRRLAVMP